jgi:CHAD domain-containing protein
MPGLRQLPAGEATCRLLRAHLDAAHRARRRLKKQTDDEALHDFRVALRRLRSVLRAYRRHLKTAPRKLRRQLRALAKATNAGRDAEVQLEWLRRQQGLDSRERAGCDWFVERLERSREEAYAGIQRDLRGHFSDLEARLRKTLRTVPAAKSGSYAAVTAGLVAEYAARLDKELTGIRTVADEDAIHAARIAGKHLRYLLEPLAAEVAGAKRAVDAMKAFQDRFGLLCDSFVRRRALLRAGETLDVRAGALDSVGQFRPGLAALTRRVEAETERRYADIERRYLGHAAEKFLRPIPVIGRRLGAVAHA